MPKHNNPYTLVFVCIVATICALLLSTAASFLREKQEANSAYDVKLNILKSFAVLPEKATRAEVEHFFINNIEGITVDATGNEVNGSAEDIDPEFEAKTKAPEDRLYPVYILRENDARIAYTIPIIGKGLWSKLYGYLSLNSDFNTIRGITFYKHGETPGLGAEIAAEWFQKNFQGKKILDESGEFVSVSVVKGKADNFYDEPKISHYVDGISGATITSRGVTAMLKKDLNNYLPFFAQKRVNYSGD